MIYFLLLLLMESNNQISFYDILNINIYESIENIKLAYKNKIKIFKNKELNNNDIIIIKKLKMALFILTNEQLRNTYNNLLLQKLNNNSENNEKTIINEISTLNDDDNNINLDILFQNPQSQINSLSNENKFIKENKINNIISDRVFSIPNTQKIMINNLLPQQTREEKKLL